MTDDLFAFERRSAVEVLRDGIRERQRDSMEFFRASEIGNGDRFASRYVDDIRCDYTARFRRWYVADPSNRWVLDNTGEITRRALRIVEAMFDRARDLGDDGGDLLAHARRSDTLHALKNMAASGADTHGLLVDAVVEFDARRDILAAGNTAIELLDDGIRARSLERSDMVTRDTGVAYVPSRLIEPPAMVSNFLETFIPDVERQRLLFKVLGLALYGANTHRLFVVLKGTTSTGKTQLVEAISNALGPYAEMSQASIFRGHMDDKPRPDILNAVSRRLTFLSEAGASWELHGDRVKDMTGGGAIPARGMHSDDFVTVQPQFTPFLVTNEMPRISGVDAATRRRILVIEFACKPDVEDKTIKQKFIHDPEVLEWLLARIVAGYEDAAQNGIEDALDAFAFDTATAFEDLTHTGEFINWLRDSEQLELVSLDDQQTYGIKRTYATLDEMHDRYLYWVKHRGNRRDRYDALSIKDFGKDMRASHGWEVVTSGQKRWLGKQLKVQIPSFEVQLG